MASKSTGMVDGASRSEVRKDRSLEGASGHSIVTGGQRLGRPMPSAAGPMCCSLLPAPRSWWPATSDFLPGLFVRSNF